MATHELSKQARADLSKIARYTQERWGEEQAVRYIRGLKAACLQLAQRPTLGRALLPNQPHQRRMEVVSHVIFYRTTPTGIFVRRILHKSMLPEKHL